MIHSGGIKVFVGLLIKSLKKTKLILAFIDYKYYGQYIKYLKKYDLNVIYGTHNVQSRIARQKPHYSFRELLIDRLLFIIYYFHEKLYFKHADRLLAVSEKDAKYYKKYIENSRVISLPNFIDEEIYVSNRVQKEDYIVMTANFIAFQNDTGIRWFIKEVWNEKMAKRAKLVLAGIGSEEILEKINKISQTHNIVALGKQESLKEIIQKALLAIVPLLDGSGTRLKCIEAMALKTQLVSTSRGAEGIEHGGSILIADEPGEFKQKIYDVLDGRTNTTVKAFEVFMDKYSFSANLNIFHSMLPPL